MSFEPRTATLTGTIALDGAVDDVFPLFSPLGERHWVEGWDPEILFPRDSDWAQGMVFRTITEGREDVWVVAGLDARAHRVVYYRTEPGLLVARVEVCCRALDERRTEATTTYSYVGLSNTGNAHIASWTTQAYAAKMHRWEQNINRWLAGRAGSSRTR
jgi:hypothetical protein